MFGRMGGSPARGGRNEELPRPGGEGANETTCNGKLANDGHRSVVYSGHRSAENEILVGKSACLVDAVGVERTEAARYALCESALLGGMVGEDGGTGVGVPGGNLAALSAGVMRIWRMVKARAVQVGQWAVTDLLWQVGGRCDNGG